MIASRYVLTPTHLHEFKSADKSQAPIMSLYLPEQKLGSHSAEGASSNKFMLKGRQTGSLHRGHSWVFRVESYDTLLEWYNDIKALTEKSPQERNAYVRQHARSISATSQRAASVASSDGMVDEDDDEPFSANASAIVNQGPKQDVLPRRPQAGGRFPSEIQVITQRGLQAPLSPSSGSSGLADSIDRDSVVASGGVVGDSGPVSHQQYGEEPTAYGQSTLTHATLVNQAAQEDGVNPYTYERIPNSSNNTYNDQTTRQVAGIPSPFGVAAADVPTSNPYDNHDQQPTISRQQNLVQQNENQQFADDAFIAPGLGSQKQQVEQRQQLQQEQQLQHRQQLQQRQQLEQQAMRESSTVAAPDTYVASGISSAAAAQQAPLAQNYVDPNAARYDGLSDTGTESTHADYIQTPPTSDSNHSHAGSVAKSTSDWPVLNGGQSYRSGNSISQLHVPGEYPRDARPV